MKKSRNTFNNEKGISEETINTCSSQNCSSDGTSSTRKSDKERGGRRRNKTIPTESEKSNEYSRTKRNGKRVRKLISRGVQTQPKKKISHNVKRKICNFFKFKWRSRKVERREKKKQTHSEIGTGESPAAAEVKNVEVIHKPRENSGRNNDFKDTKSSDATSDTNDKKTKEKPSQTNGNNMQKKSYNRKYDFSIDGTDVEVIRTEKSGTGEKSSDLPKKYTHPSTAADPQEKISNTRRKRRARSKQNARKKAAVANKRNLLVSDEVSSGQIDERKDDKLKTHEIVKRKDEAVDKTGKIDEPRKLKSINNRASNSEEKDAPQRGGKTDKSVISHDENPATKEETVRSRETKKSPIFKLFAKSEPDSLTPHQPSNEESHNEGRRNIKPRTGKPVNKQLDARRNEIAEAKKRLDVCIADLNSIILNLSKVFEQVPASGAGPAGEGASSGNLNRSRRGRTRLG